MSVVFVVVVSAVFASGVFVTADPVTSALCRTNCIHEFLGTEPKEDRDCAIHPDCFLCWEHCGLLSKSNSSRLSLCEDNKCSEGCEVACGFFRSKRQLPKERLVFPGEPVLKEDLLEWGPVPNASLYSVSLVFLNRTMSNLAQTVSCKIKIPKPQLMKVIRIVIIAVNKSGALGLTNFNLMRRIVKKNVSSAITKLREVLDPKVPPGLPSSTLNPPLWVTQGKTVNLDDTLAKTNISWQFVDNRKSDMLQDFLVKWWTPDLNMEGRIVVNGSQSIELTYLFKYFCFVKVKIIGLDIESQILVLKNDKEEFLTQDDIMTKHWLTFLSLNAILVLCIVTSKSICRCWSGSDKFKKTTTICYEVNV